MSIILSLLILILCLSFHPCNARPFGVIHEGSSTVQLHFSGEVVEKVKLLDHFNSSVGRGTSIGHSIVDDNKISHGGATTREPKDSIKKISGTEIFESSSNVNLLNKATTATQGWRRRALLVESGTDQVKKAVEYFSNDKVEEEEVAMTDDYNPPHQTPPIHNRQT
ncbi:uncharacterized protein LOC116126535 [Pistacia vera]|uniref:uncharacterized protein LOC116126535 n=1 Tax=Pistacia vera TaxID=55513 RepID=UPI001263E4EC|nr:uncharacterized protein LOC116126535 [Pistacia vera]